MPAAPVPWSDPPPRPRLSPRQLHLWRFRLDPPPADLEILESLLSEDERNRARRLVDPLKSRAFVAGRGRLRQILGRYLDRDPATLRFGYGPAGKPFLAAPPLPLSFNLSHAGPWGLLAVTESGAIGVDLECLNAPVDFRQIARRFFTAKEQADLASAAPDTQRQRFYTLWTAREARLKALGGGLSTAESGLETPLRLYHFPVAPEILGALAAEPGPWEMRHWYLAATDSE